MKLPNELMFLKNRNLPQKTTGASLKGKTAVITGSTSGVGLSAAKHLAKGGANLVLVARSAEKAERVKKEILSEHSVRIDIVIGDFSDLDEVRKVADEILKKCPKIDVLIQSAGLHSTKRMLTKEGFETVFCVNHLAAFLLNFLLLDRMKESAPSRIILVNSEGHRFNGLNLKDLNWEKRIYRGLKSYGASKTAQLLSTWEFADLLSGSGVTINAMHPGDVKTNIGSNNGKIYNWYLHHIIWHTLRDVDISGRSLYYLAAAPEMAEISGRFFHLTIDEIPAPHALDRKKGKEIFEISKKLTGLS